MEKRKKVVVFGIFDGAHKGHHFLFSQAKKYGDHLIAIVGRDKFVRSFKNKEPVYSENERMERLLKENIVDEVFLSDEKVSSYKVLREINPDVICLGFDQNVLRDDLRRWMNKNDISIPTIRLEKLQSSLQKTK